MWRGIAVASGLLLVVGCGGEDSPASEAEPASTSAVAAGDQVGYLNALRSSALLGAYEDAELVALGRAFCDLRQAGEDPLTSGVSNGDGTFSFEEVAAPVWASDTIGIDIEARQHLCP